MVIFQWDKNLEIGIPIIDQQHKKIIEAANAFFLSYKCGGKEKNTEDCLNFLSQYVLYHFQAEEAFQLESQYPEVRPHQAKHKYLTAQVKFHTTRILQSGFDAGIVKQFHDFIQDWIVGHILTDDIAFAKFYRQKQGKIQSI